MQNKIEKISPLYTLWLPITDFATLRKNLKESQESNEITIEVDSANSTWSWIVFSYEEATITVDSLGFIYLDKINSLDLKKSCLVLLEKLLNVETKSNVLDTFLNVQIGFDFTRRSEKEVFITFLETILIGFNALSDNLKLEYIYASLYVNLKEQKHENTTIEFDVKYKISSMKKMKFSFREEEKRDEKFQTILNRNFKNLLEKSVHFTHSLFFERGELYELSIIQQNFNQNTDFVNFELFVNREDQSIKREKLFNQIFKKAIQDTIEERTILHFLKITRRTYLRQIIDEISKKNELLKQLNSYLLDDLERSMENKETETHASDDELVIELFIQNLLQAIPKFQMIDAKLKEGYYVKIGNTTTTLQVNSNETIVGTLDYAKWKSLVKFFMDTASKVNESLTMYHQNKILKELEDISYNANYQADIEDIRELQKHKELSLDESSKTVFLWLAVVALAGEAPLFDTKLWLFEITKSNFTFFQTFQTNLLDIFLNSSFYAMLLFFLVKPLFFERVEPYNYDKKISKTKRFFEYIKKLWKRDNNIKTYFFEESDYDKHEHRSNKLLLSYNKESGEFEKQTITYNNSVSSYELVKLLKKTIMQQRVKSNTLNYQLFPKILKETPIDETTAHIYRENYRISGNNRVATKIMYRYKISKLSLESLIEYMKKDAFMIAYAPYLEEQGYSVTEQYEILKPLKKNSLYLTLYIVYSFVLKFHEVKDGRKYTYNISKDQFRVHYHINKLEYIDREEFESKQDALAKLLDIYFLGRLKRSEM